MKKEGKEKKVSSKEFREFVELSLSEIKKKPKEKK